MITTWHNMTLIIWCFATFRSMTRYLKIYTSFYHVVTETDCVSQLRGIP